MPKDIICCRQEFEEPGYMYMEVTSLIDGVDGKAYLSFDADLYNSLTHDKESALIPISYCPFCGREMSELGE